MENFVYHLKIYTGEKPCPRHVCGKAITKMDYKKKGVIIHTGDNPNSVMLTVNRLQGSKL